jgi:hypothetical protein
LIGVRNNDGEYEHWWFHDAIDLIAAYAQPEYLKVEMEYNDELRPDNFDRLEAMKAAKLVEADEKKNNQKGKNGRAWKLNI